MKSSRKTEVKLDNKMPEVYSSEVKLTDKFVTISLPSSVAKYLNLSKDDRKIFWCGINDGIQITKEIPKLIIPVITNLDDFEDNED